MINEFLKKTHQLKDWSYNHSISRHSKFSNEDCRDILDKGLNFQSYVHQFSLSNIPTSQNNKSTHDCFNYLLSSFLIINSIPPVHPFNTPHPSSLVDGCPYNYSQILFRNFNINHIESAKSLILLIQTFFIPGDINSISVFFPHRDFKLRYILFLFEEFKEEYLTFPAIIDGKNLTIFLAILSNPSLTLEDLELVLKPILKPSHLSDIAWTYIATNCQGDCLKFFMQYLPSSPTKRFEFITKINKFTQMSVLFSFLVSPKMTKETLELILPFITKESLSCQALHNISMNFASANNWFELLFPIYEENLDLFYIKNSNGTNGLMACVSSENISFFILNKILQIVSKDNKLLSKVDNNSKNFLFYLFHNPNIDKFISALKDVQISPSLLQQCSIDFDTPFHNLFSNPHLTYQTYLAVRDWISLSTLGQKGNKKRTCLHNLAMCVSDENNVLSMILRDIFVHFFQFDLSPNEAHIDLSPANMLSPNRKLTVYQESILFSEDQSGMNFLKILTKKSIKLELFLIISKILTLTVLSHSSVYGDDTILHNLFSYKSTPNCLHTILSYLLDNNLIVKKNLLQPNGRMVTPFILIHNNPTLYLTEDLKQKLVLILGGQIKYDQEYQKMIQNNVSIYFQ